MTHCDETRAGERIAPGVSPQAGKPARASLTGFQRLALFLAALGCVLLIGVSVTFLDYADVNEDSASQAVTQEEQVPEQGKGESMQNAKKSKKGTSSSTQAGAEASSAEADQGASVSGKSAGGSSSGKNASAGSSSGSSQAQQGSQPQGSQSQESQDQGSQDAQQTEPRTVTVHVSVSSASVGNPVSTSTTLTFAEGATVYDALCGTGLSINAASTAYGVYVAGINGLAEKEHGAMSGWTYCVNGVYANRSCSAYVLSDGDSISWIYITG